MKHSVLEVFIIITLVVMTAPLAVSAGQEIEKEVFGIEAVPFQRMSLLKNTLYVFEKMGLGLLGRNRLPWNYIEPRRPDKGKHYYRWDKLDEEFRLYHDSGFRLQIVLQSRSPWGTVVSSKRLPRVAGSPPKKEHWEDWGHFIYELVERYDGDGYRDAFRMNHALIKILSLHGEIEFPNNWKKWGGTYENYHKLMRITSFYAKKADSKVLIARAGTSMGPIFDTDPPIEIIKKMSQKSAFDREVSKFLEYTLNNPQDYDLFAIHTNRDYTGIEPFVRMIRNEMKKKGYLKPILIEDASSVYAARKREPLAKAENEKLIPYYGALKRKNRKMAYQEAKRIIQEHQAILTLKKSTLALFSDVQYTLFSGYLDKKGSPAIQLLHGGFIDTQNFKTTRNLEKALKPVYYSFKLFLDKVIGAQKDIERLNLGKDVYVFRFQKNGRPFYFLWAEGHETKIEIPIDAPYVLKTGIITEENTIEPEIEKLAVKNSRIQLSLNTVPFFLEVMNK